MAGKTREVETVVTKPPKNPGAGQVHSEYSTKTGEVDTFVTKPLTNPGAGQVYFECGSTHVFVTMTLCVSIMFVDYPFSTCSRCVFSS